MKTRWEVVATFNDLEKAEAAKNRLMQADFEARVADDSTLQRLVYLSKPLACDKVLVKEGDCRRAREFLKSCDDTEHILSGQVCCPQCGSPRVDYPQFGRKFITSTFLAVCALTLRIFDKEFFCRDCHHAWPPEIKLRHQTDILDWPVKHRGKVRQERG